jgi:hypothetical protein
MKLIVSLFLAFTFLLSNAQDFKVSFSNEDDKNYSVGERFGDNFYDFSVDMKGVSGFSASLDRSIHSIELKKYDAGMKLVKSVKVANGERQFGPMIPLIKIISGRLYLFYFKMQESGTVKLFSAAINPVSLELAEPSEILEIRETEADLKYHMRMVGQYDKNRTDPYKGPTFFFESSPDSSKFVIAWNSGWHSQLFFSVFDKNMNKIRTTNETIKYSGELLLCSAFIDNAGNMGITYRLKTGSKTFAKLLVNTTDGKSLTKEIQVPGCQPTYLFAVVSKAGLDLVGTYSENEIAFSGVFSGSFTFQDMKLETVTKTAVPASMVDLFDADGWASTKKNNYGLSRNVNMKAVILKDGHIDLIGEFLSNTKTVYIDNTGSKSYSDVRSGSIINARFADNAVIFSRIPKLRRHDFDIFSASSRLIEFNNKLIFFYSDSKENLKRDISKEPVKAGNQKDLVLAAAIVEKDGSVTRKVVLDPDGNGYVTDTESIKEISPDVLFFSMRRLKFVGVLTDDQKKGILEIR